MVAKLTNTHRELLKHCLSLANDPVALVHFAFEWKDGERLEDWQYEALDLWGQHMRSGEKLPFRYAAASGHGIGKSTMAGFVTFCHLLSHPNSRVVITANTFAQATQKTFRAVHEWRMRLIEPLRDLFELTQTSARWVDPDHRNVWVADVTSWSEDRLEGFQGLHAPRVAILVDEASALPSTLFEVIEGALTTGEASLWAFGNPTVTSGHFHKLFHGREGDAGGWVRRNIDSRTVSFTNKALLEQQIRMWGADSDQARVRIYGQFPRAGSLSLFPRDLLSAAIQRQAIEQQVRPVLGVDPAYMGDDMSVVAERTTNKVSILKQYHKMDTADLADELVMLAKQRNARSIVVDVTGGLGAGVVDNLRRARHSIPGVRIVPLNMQQSAIQDQIYANARVEIYNLLLKFLKDEGAAIQNDPDLIEELASTDLDGHDMRGRMKLVKKDAIKLVIGRSPDKADAAALTMASQPGGYGHERGADYSNVDRAILFPSEDSKLILPSGYGPRG